MVDVSSKPEILSEATAAGTIRLKPETITLVIEGKIAKGDPLYTAKIAGILAAKKCSDLVPLCHPLPLTKVEVEAKVLSQVGFVVPKSGGIERDTCNLSVAKWKKQPRFPSVNRRNRSVTCRQMQMWGNATAEPFGRRFSPSEEPF